MMTPSHARWQVDLDANDDQEYALLSQDPVWNSFALAACDIQALKVNQVL